MTLAWCVLKKQGATFLEQVSPGRCVFILTSSFESSLWIWLQSPAIHDRFKDQVHNTLEALPMSFPGSTADIQKVAGRDNRNHKQSLRKVDEALSVLFTFEYVCAFIATSHLSSCFTEKVQIISELLSRLPLSRSPHSPSGGPFEEYIPGVQDVCNLRFLQ